MEPVSLAVGLITTFKELYLLSRCVYKVCKSARVSDEEREKLRRDLRSELVFVQSFGQFYLSQSNATNDERLGMHWAAVMQEIFEDIRKARNDYKELDDPQYLQYSPYINKSMYGSNRIEFRLEVEIPDPAIKNKKMAFNLSIFNRVRETSAAAGKSAKWVLFDKKKLETTVVAFQKETRKLRGLLPFAQSAQFSKLLDNKFEILTETIRDQNADRLGLVPHAKLIELNEGD